MASKKASHRTHRPGLRSPDSRTEGDSVALVIEDNPHQRTALLNVIAGCKHVKWNAQVYRGRQVFSLEADNGFAAGPIPNVLEEQLRLNGLWVGQQASRLDQEETGRWLRIDGPVPRYLKVNENNQRRCDVFDGNFDFENVLSWTNQQLDHASATGARRICIYLDLSWNNDLDTQDRFIKLLLCPESAAIRIRDEEWTGGLRLIRELSSRKLSIECTLVAISTFGAASMKALARHLGATHTIQKYPELKTYFQTALNNQQIDVLQDRYARELGAMVSEVFQDAVEACAFKYSRSGVTALEFTPEMLSTNQTASERLARLRRTLKHESPDGSITIPLDVEALRADLDSFWDFLLEHPSQQKQFVLETALRTHNQIAVSRKLIGGSRPIVQVRDTIVRLAPTDLTVLLRGRNGTGKDVAAAVLHENSNRYSGPFICVNCAALADSLLESELFGHEENSFNGAEKRIGKFEAAHDGTIFLDEIGDMSLSAQSRLLRVLENRVVTRVGANNDIPVNVRVVAATNVDLVTAVRERKFREDLYYRLSVATIEMPELHELGADIVVLAEHFLVEAANKSNIAKPQLSEYTKEKLLKHRWPGNIRELRNLMDYLVVMLPGKVIEPEHVKFVASVSGAGVTGNVENPPPRLRANGNEERELIVGALEKTNWNVTKAAKILGIDRTTLHPKMNKLGITRKRNNAD